MHNQNSAVTGESKSSRVQLPFPFTTLSQFEDHIRGTLNDVIDTVEADRDELLAVCRELHEDLYGMCKHYKEPLRPSLRHAVTAIAKAEGRKD